MDNETGPLTEDRSGPSRDSGDFIADNGMVLGGRWVPLLSGEVQFFRMDPDSWEPSLVALKGLGLPMVSTYLSWRRFSTGPDRYDLAGSTNPRLNVRKFLELCGSLDLRVTLKPGPWICAEETNGGYPDWLVEKAELQVLDAEGRAVRGYVPPFDSPIPSYLNPTYLEHVRVWLAEVDKSIAGYLYPHGPVVLVQLDNEPCMTFHDRLFESDYNATVAGPKGAYARWLADKYGSVEKLTVAHGASYRSFAGVQPPRKLSIGGWSDLRSYTDWAEFKEVLLASHIEKIAAMHRENGLGGVTFTTNYNEHAQLAVPNNWQLLERASGIGGFDYYPRLPMLHKDFESTAMAIAYSRAVNRVPWSPEIMCGIWDFEGQRHGGSDLSPKDYTYLYLTCLAFGLKGMNFYMLADRDNWVGSPLDSRGRLGRLASSVEHVTKLITTLPEFPHLTRRQPLALLYYRPYAREAFVAGGAAITLDGYAIGSAYSMFQRLFGELLWHNVDPAIVDPWVNPRAVFNFQKVVLAGSPYMDRDTQELLREYVRRGGTLIVVGSTPARDLDLMPFALLGDSDIPEGGGWSGSPENRKGILRATTNGTSESSSAGGPLWHLLSTERAPAVEVLNEGVLAVMHEYKENRVLFVINTNDHAEVADLKLEDRKTVRLEDGLDRERSLVVADGRVSTELAPRSVEAWTWTEGA